MIVRLTAIYNKMARMMSKAPAKAGTLIYLLHHTPINRRSLAAESEFLMFSLKIMILADSQIDR